jgi:hypothetical protein
VSSKFSFLTIILLDIVSPLNDLPDTFSSKTVDYEFKNSEEVFHEVEPDTGIHGVKLINGHLHLNNETYDYYDPSRPHASNIHENRETAVDYVVTGTFFFACLLLVIFVLWVIFKGFRWALGYQGYSKFDNDRGDSVSR